MPSCGSPFASLARRPLSPQERPIFGADGGRRVWFAVVVTPVDLQDLESSKKTGSLDGSTSGRIGNGVSSRSSAGQRLGLHVVRARLHDGTPRIFSRAAEL